MLFKCFTIIYLPPLGEVWKKLDEEDTQIESSLPNYLATVYGNLSHVTDHSPLLFNSPSFHGNTLVPLSETVAKQPEYVPPPDCLSLVDCRVIGQLVSLLAIVTQGKGCGQVLHLLGFIYN